MQAALDKSKDFPTTQPEAKFNAAQPVPDVESELAGKAAPFAADNVITRNAGHTANNAELHSTIKELRETVKTKSADNDVGKGIPIDYEDYNQH